jgi:hypothetical protein
MKNFFGMIVRRVKDYRERALEVYVKTRGAFDINEISKMCGHLDKCENERCK